jgi:Ser/Thr protein kinase RdoA (MazF antagonist)
VSERGVDESLIAPFTRLTKDRISSIAREEFGAEVQGLRRLDTERDDTYVLDLESGSRALLKVANPVDAPAAIDLSVQVLVHVHDRDEQLPVPRVIPTRSGELHTTVAGMDQEPRIARMLTWLPGRIPTLDVLTERQAASRGRWLGRLNSALADFQHPGASRYLAWDLQQVGTLRAHLGHIVNPHTRSLVEAELDQFDERTGPALRDTRQQVIHNDLNSDNLLVDQADTDVVVGILDFGDVVQSATVADLGLAMSYVIDVTRPDADPWINPYACARAFHAERGLTDAEWTLLPGLVRARLCQRLLLGSWLSAMNPDNAEYTSRTLASATTALNLVHNSAPHEGLRHG